MEFTLRQAVREFENSNLDCPSHEIIRKWANQGRIKARRVRSVWKTRLIWQIDRESLENYLKRRKHDREEKNQAKQDSARQSAARGHRPDDRAPAQGRVQGTARSRVQGNHRDGPNGHGDHA